MRLVRGVVLLRDTVALSRTGINYPIRPQLIHPTLVNIPTSSLALLAAKEGTKIPTESRYSEVAVRTQQLDRAEYVGGGRSPNCSQEFVTSTLQS